MLLTADIKLRFSPNRLKCQNQRRGIIIPRSIGFENSSMGNKTMTEPLTPNQKIQLAADKIDQQLQDKGIFNIGRAECLRLARLLYDIWMRPGGPQHHIPQGEVAQKFRERYEHVLIDGPLLDR